MLKNELELIKAIEYTRFGGTKQEYKTAMWIIDRLGELGIDGHYEPFKVTASIVSANVLSVDGVDVKCRAYFNCASVNELKAPLYYYTGRDKVSLSEVAGKIVLVDGYLGYWTYKDLVDNHAAAIIVHNGNLYDDNTDIDQREVRELHRSAGVLPVVQIHTKDAYWMIQSGKMEATLTIASKDVTAESGNVVCDIKGQSDKTIVFTAHYDSTWLSKGSYDNATGTIGLLKLAEYFRENRPYHNLRFVFCGSEERGLLGSKAYVKQHHDELENMMLCINLDMIGSTMGRFEACVSAETALVNYLSYMACEEGVSLHTYQDVYSSDSTPFADSGVPSLSFARNTNVTPIHCRHDTCDSLSLVQIKDDIAFIVAFASRMANAKVFPVERKIPETIKDKLDIYTCRKRKE